MLVSAVLLTSRPRKFVAPLDAYGPSSSGCGYDHTLAGPAQAPPPGSSRSSKNAYDGAVPAAHSAMSSTSGRGVGRPVAATALRTAVQSVAVKPDVPTSASQAAISAVPRSA